MPHIKLEHTEKVDSGLIKPVFKKLKVILMETAGIKENNCKCKAIRIPVYSVGRNNTSGHFFHLEVCLLKGRSADVRKEIGQKSIQVLQEHFVDNNAQNIKQFSVEIREIHHNDYFTSNTL